MATSLACRYQLFASLPEEHVDLSPLFVVAVCTQMTEVLLWIPTPNTALKLAPGLPMIGGHAPGLLQSIISRVIL